jgi:hypothetical protein
VEFIFTDFLVLMSPREVLCHSIYRLEGDNNNKSSSVQCKPSHSNSSNSERGALPASLSSPSSSIEILDSAIFPPSSSLVKMFTSSFFDPLLELIEVWRFDDRRNVQAGEKIKIIFFYFY